MVNKNVLFFFRNKIKTLLLKYLRLLYVFSIFTGKFKGVVHHMDELCVYLPPKIYLYLIPKIPNNLYAC